jgi:hypothetical protein
MLPLGHSSLTIYQVPLQRAHEHGAFKSDPNEPWLPARCCYGRWAHAADRASSCRDQCVRTRDGDRALGLRPVGLLPPPPSRRIVILRRLAWSGSWCLWQPGLSRWLGGRVGPGSARGNDGWTARIPAVTRTSTMGPVVALAGWPADQLDQIEALGWRGWIETQPRLHMSGTTALREPHGRFCRASRRENR